jgi:hypothetical protein
MNKLWDRLYTGVGVISMGGALAAMLGGALMDRALHPADTYRDIRERRAGTQSPQFEAGNPPTQRPCEMHISLDCGCA